MTTRLLTLALATIALVSTPAFSGAPDLGEAAGHYAIGPQGSIIRFAIGQIDGGGLQGKFGRFSGNIQIDGSDLSRSKVDLTIAPDSVSTGKERIDNFLRSDAVFDSANAPAIVFHSTSVQRTDDGSAVVKGRLTARGKSATETFNVRLENFAKGHIVFHVTGKILRSRYRMDVGTPIYSNVVDFDMRFDAHRR